MHHQNFDIHDLNKTLKAYWNDVFKTLIAEVINKDDIKVSNPLDQALKDLGDSSETILDIGTGQGYCLFAAFLLGTKVKKGFGIDPSKHAIDFARETARLSGLKGLSFEEGDHTILQNMTNASFDGIICSNVLDVIPYQTSEELIHMMDNLLKPGGILLLKFNFYLTDELIKKLGMEAIEENTYRMNGILRGVNLTTEAWIKRFPGYELFRIEQYERVPNGPKDRVIMLKKQLCK
ncbi:MAG: class I SAM-dependent methyltransferase [Acholeplasmataceae bacterium]|nr:class I SAM-dependent methyltransferase [Acholeplasmataceae bacterium]